MLRLWWSDESARKLAGRWLRPAFWRSRQIERQKAFGFGGVETCSRRSASDGRLKYPIGKNEARESSEMSKAVEPATASASTDMSVLFVTPFTVSRALASVLKCSYFSLLSMSFRAQKDPYMTLPYPFPVCETHRLAAGPSGDES